MLRMLLCRRLMQKQGTLDAFLNKPAAAKAPKPPRPKMKRLYADAGGARGISRGILPCPCCPKIPCMRLAAFHAASR